MMFLPIIVLIIFVLFYLNPSKSESNLDYRKVSNSTEALDILDRRFATGEISKDEYFKIKSILK